MDAKFLKILMLAAVADGEVQSEELERLHQYKQSHPKLKDIPDDTSWAAIADVHNKLKADITPQQILEHLGPEFSQNEKESAFAMANEVCASDFNMLPSETEFLQLVINTWSIPDDVVHAVERSIQLRYSIQ